MDKIKQSEAQRNERLPIKVILPKQGIQNKVTGGGSSEPFRNVDGSYRASLSNQVTAIKNTVQFDKVDAAPVRVKLIPTATAKSHRPIKLFSEETCPIVGSGALGELFIKASPNGLNKLNHLILHNATNVIKKELSAIEAIEPITPIYRRKGLTPRDILRKCPKRDDRFVARVRLFDLGIGDNSQLNILNNFREQCNSLNLEISSSGYSQSSLTYELRCRSINEIEEVSKIIGVRSVTQMPIMRILKPKSFNERALAAMPQRNSNDDIPVVVVVDSGIGTENKDLESWVVGRIQNVAPEYRNTSHGTFVAGLICWGGQLNPHISTLDVNPVGVFDLQVIPNDDPGQGDIEDLTESELLISLDTALKTYANKYKVWNLSLGSDYVCSLDEFSSLAESLDDLQEKYQVSFVISAGNFESLPMLDYPRKKDQINSGRITSPADSVLGITVGSISHIDYRANGPKRHQLAPYSRHGAGPNHIIKPDLVHYGGTCTFDATHLAGIRSVTENGSAEDMGTSFSTPLVSRTLAQIYHQIIPTPSPVLARALLTHHASDPRTGSRIPEGEENYFGFGLPSPVPYCLECTPYTSTLIFEDTLRPGYYLEWDDFPYPDSLKVDGRYFGEIWMTIAFTPSRGARWGTEYCETHIEANFGVYYTKTSRDTKEQKEVFKGLVPPEFKNSGLLYESFQIESLRKWSPVRTYHGVLDEKGERGNRWRLKLKLLTRHGIELSSTFKPQKFALIVTITDPQKRVSVYDEMARKIRNRFQADNLNLRVSPQIRQRGASGI